MLTPLDKAVLAVGGRQKTLAERLDISAQAVSQIKKRGAPPQKTYERPIGYYWIENRRTVSRYF